MMSLPSFEGEPPTIEQLRDEQERLHLQADKLLATTGIKDILSSYGQPMPIGGSYLYGLLVYPDLDLGVVAPDFGRKEAAQLLSKLSLSSYIQKISWADTVNFPLKNAGHPRGYWFGVEIPFEQDVWGIDCWFVTKDDSDSTFQERLLALPESSKDTILRIKYDMIRQGLYGKEVQSVDVYNGVINGSVHDSISFIMWHRRQS
jgi:hypothetical protein